MTNTQGRMLPELPPSRDSMLAIAYAAIERRQPPEEPFVLASGARSWVYADIKHPLSSGAALRTVGSYAVAKLQEAG